MAKIIKSDTGHYIGKAIYPGTSYSTTGWCKELPTKELRIVTVDNLLADIEKHLKAKVIAETEIQVINLLAFELCHERHGMIYISDYQAPFRVRKVVPVSPLQSRKVIS